MLRLHTNKNHNLSTINYLCQNLPAVPHAGSAGATAPPTAASIRRTTSPLAGIVTAAVFSDAAHIVEEIALLKTRTNHDEDRGGG